MLEQKVQETRISACFSLLSDLDFHPILFKGYVAAANYPKDHDRRYADLDIAVPFSEYEKVREYLPELFKKHIPVDLHCEFRQLDTLDWDELYSRSEIKRIGDSDVRVPCPEDHLRILCVHWLNDGGEYRERLWDIYYAVANRPQDFDWDKCLGCVSKVRREWVIYCIGLAHKYLGLDIKQLPFKEEALNLPAWLPDFLEKEWASNIRTVPLRIAYKRHGMILKQIGKRIPPNPLLAAVQTESSLDTNFLLSMQLRSIFLRSKASIKRFLGITNVTNKQ